ncbi:hypothetical protein AB0K08_08805 [Citricoccus sp. NPDC055426]|uniref:hypothetical protein n=1 Tax=Citricoccus sp. NPDC055426 TaxID=3155536 RepID=UPI003420B8C8
MTTALPHLRPVRADDAAAVLAAFTSHPDMERQGDVTTLDQAQNLLARLTDPDGPQPSPTGSPTNSAAWSA